MAMALLRDAGTVGVGRNEAGVERGGQVPQALLRRVEVSLRTRKEPLRCLKEG